MSAVGYIRIDVGREAYAKGMDLEVAVFVVI